MQLNGYSRLKKSQFVRILRHKICCIMTKPMERFTMATTGNGCNTSCLGLNKIEVKEHLFTGHEARSSHSGNHCKITFLSLRRKFNTVATKFHSIHTEKDIKTSVRQSSRFDLASVVQGHRWISIDKRGFLEETSCTGPLCVFDEAPSLGRE